MRACSFAINRMALISNWVNGGQLVNADELQLKEEKIEEKYIKRKAPREMLPHFNQNLFQTALSIVVQMMTESSRFGLISQTITTHRTTRLTVSEPFTQKPNGSFLSPQSRNAVVVETI